MSESCSKCVCDDGVVREKLLEDILLRCYAHEICRKIHELVAENCEACEIDDPSQKHHACMMMPVDQRVWSYFDEALDCISEACVIKQFCEQLKDITPRVNGLELIKYTCGDWRQNLCTEKKKAELEELTHELIEFLIIIFCKCVAV